MAIMKIYNYDDIPREKIYRFGKEKFEDIKEMFQIKITKEDYFMPFKKDGVLYSPCISSMEEGWIICKIFEYDNEIDADYTPEITCPYCGQTIMDSWEKSDSENEEICDRCKSTFSYQREVTVEYCSQKIHQNMIMEI